MKKMSVWMGNADTREAYRDADDELAYRHLAGHRVTAIGIHPDTPLARAFTMITDPNGVWAHQSYAPPAWVASESEGLALLLAEHYGCPSGRPLDEEWN